MGCYLHVTHEETGLKELEGCSLHTDMWLRHSNTGHAACFMSFGHRQVLHKRLMDMAGSIRPPTLPLRGSLITAP